MYKPDNTLSYFDNPERSSDESIESDKKILALNNLVTKLLDGFPNAALLLNKNRQIIAYNKNAVNLVADFSKSVFGQRVGEALGCVHAFEMSAGCGTSKFCEECGAGQCNKYTSESLKDSKLECRIIVEKNNSESSLDLRVSTSIVEVDGNDYILFAVEDIQDEKRRKVLEKIFFHDVLNTANSVFQISEMINTTEQMEEVNEFKDPLVNTSEQLIREIQMQRDLINAEQGTLSVNNNLVSINDILNRTFTLYKDHKYSIGKNYKVILSEQDENISTDLILLSRSLGNLIKNALEATDLNGTISLYAVINNETISFCVFNDKIIPKQIQLQIFQRSFSTKAKFGRGIGTYSVKLIVEQYLNGKVSFISNEELKTIFMIELPRFN